MRIKEVNIRPATEKDIPGVDALWEEAARYHEKLDSRFAMQFDNAQGITEFHERQLTADQVLFLVAVYRETVVGYVIARVAKAPPHHHITRVGVIDGMAVTQSHRGKGIGSALYDQVLAWFIDQKTERLDTYVATKNPRAQAFWERKGFVPRMYQISLELTTTRD